MGRINLHKKAVLSQGQWHRAMPN